MSSSMTNRIGLFLDSGNVTPKVPQTIDEWIHAKSYKEFVDVLEKFYNEQKQLPKIISINHDLTNDHFMLELRRPQGVPIAYEMYTADTGLHAVQYLCNFIDTHKVSLPLVFAHGLNNTGNANITKLVTDYYKYRTVDLISSIMNWEFKQ